MSFLFRLSILSVLWVVSATVDALGTEGQFEVVQSTFLRGLDGDEAAALLAVEQLESLSRQDPTNLTLLAYLGSARTLEGRDALWPWKKISYTKRGLALLDTALRSLTPAHEQQTIRGVPISLEVTLVAGQTFITVPDSFFHRFEQGRKLLMELTADPLVEKSPEEFRAAVQLPLAHLAEIQGDRRAFRAALEQAAALDPHGPYGEKAM